MITEGPGSEECLEPLLPPERYWGSFWKPHPITRPSFMCLNGVSSLSKYFCALPEQEDGVVFLKNFGIGVCHGGCVTVLSLQAWWSVIVRYFNPGGFSHWASDF